MRAHSYRAWTHPARSLSLVYNRRLGAWILKRHNKDGTVRSRWPMIAAFRDQRDDALRVIRSTYDLRPPLSGWQRATLTSCASSTWNQVHEAAWHESAAA
jgi:hypothetical protein